MYYVVVLRPYQISKRSLLQNLFSIGIAMLGEEEKWNYQCNETQLPDEGCSHVSKLTLN
jgi:hypothetical protein